MAGFDRDGWWALDGQLSCVARLVWRTNMARSTAFEKLRVAHQLARRRVVAEAFRQGRLSYSAVRALTRLDRPDPDLAAALVELAQSGQASIGDLENRSTWAAKTRDWSIPQRRAIGVRDAGQCRFVGCCFRRCDIHHLQPWENGGNTDIDNGFSGCPRRELQVSSAQQPGSLTAPQLA